MKSKKKVHIYNKTSIKIGDVAEVYAHPSVQKKILGLSLTHVNDDAPTNILISIMDIIKAIDKAFDEDMTVNSVGEIETLVHFQKKEQMVNKYLLIAKAAFICLVLLFGSATAIMSFHTDTQIPAVFKNFYYIFFRETTPKMYIIDIPYSLGLAFGIMIFFNHMKKEKSLLDPTPIEVEMSVYDDDVVKAISAELSKGETEVGKMGEEPST